MASVQPPEQGLECIDWSGLTTALNQDGCAVLAKVLTRAACADVAALYAHEARFRSHVHMAKHGFGRGEYRYFKYPLPESIEDLRTALYPHLAQVANHWNEQLGDDRRYPGELGDFLKLCHGAGQKKPTPLLLKYGSGDYNCLHQGL